MCNGSVEIFETCKVKGIRINYANSLKINFESVLKLIRQRDNKNTVNNIRLRNNAIKRTATHEVVTCEETKTCSIVLKKRRFVSDTESYPYGFKKKECNDFVFF